jgi:uncharacterized protein
MPHTVSMNPNSVVNASALSLEHESVPAAQSIEGAPTTAAMAVDEFAGLEVGVWEMTPGMMSDVEADEVFVVLSGCATVEFADASPTLALGQGDVVRLAEGAKTIWTVTETIRKVYLTRG